MVRPGQGRSRHARTILFPQHLSIPLTHANNARLERSSSAARSQRNDSHHERARQGRDQAHLRHQGQDRWRSGKMFGRHFPG